MDAPNQAKSLIMRAQNILILPAKEQTGDVLGGVLALFFTLRKLGKNVNMPACKFPEKFRFLGDLQPTASKDFVIAIDGSEKEIGEMRYEKNEGGLKIYLTLNKGEISEQDVSFSSSGKEPDLVIALGMKSLAETGNFASPILNIDNEPTNENFGEVNLVETTLSLSEIMVGLIKLLGDDKPLFDKNISTYLLTGIISASHNFRDSRTRPKTLETAAFLIEQGADHQKIIQHLYKQKSVPQIRLLGRILEKIDFDEKRELHTASLTEKDFQECQARSTDLASVVEELNFSFRYLPNLLILWESHASPPVIKGIFCSAKPDLIGKVLANFEGVSKRSGALFVVREADLTSAKEKVLKAI